MRIDRFDLIVSSFSSGSFVSLVSNPVMEFGEATDVGRRIGMMMSILSLGALAGPPISGAINTHTGGFAAVGYYAGTPSDSLQRASLNTFSKAARFWSASP